MSRDSSVDAISGTTKKVMKVQRRIAVQSDLDEAWGGGARAEGEGPAVALGREPVEKRERWHDEREMATHHVCNGSRRWAAAKCKGSHLGRQVGFVWGVEALTTAVIREKSLNLMMGEEH
jgi:hypothetical protein